VHISPTNLETSSTIIIATDLNCFEQKEDSEISADDLKERYQVIKKNCGKTAARNTFDYHLSQLVQE
jgi:hypothetical protein